MPLIECNLKHRYCFSSKGIPSWKDYFTGLRNVCIGTISFVNISASPASFMKSAGETENWIEREVSLCFLERKIKM